MYSSLEQFTVPNLLKYRLSESLMTTELYRSTKYQFRFIAPQAMSNVTPLCYMISHAHTPYTKPFLFTDRNE